MKQMTMIVGLKPKDGMVNCEVEVNVLPAWSTVVELQLPDGSSLFIRRRDIATIAEAWPTSTHPSVDQKVWQGEKD